MSNTLILFRHGDVQHPYDEAGNKLTYGPEDSLSEMGHIQMQSLSKKLKSEGITPDVIYASPYTRAQQSASYLTKEFGIPTLTDNELHDVHVPGYWHQPWKLVEESGGDVYALPPRTEDQETLPQIVDRARGVMHRLTEGKQNTSIAVVSHGDFMCAINWVLHEKGYPASYAEMLSRGYPAKGEALLLKVDEEGRATEEGRYISTPESKITKEGFRPDTRERR